MPPLFRAGLAGLALAGLSAGPAAAQLFEIGPVDVGGAVRINVLNKSWETREIRFPRAEAEFDTARIDLTLDSESRWIGSAQVRAYYYDETERFTAFPHHAWIGYASERFGTFKAGIQQVPFGLAPYASNSYFFSIAYYAGLEDDYDLGLSWSDRQGDWSLDVAGFVSDEGNWIGESQDSARYSYDPVEEGGRADSEAGQVNLRAVWSPVAADANGLELGASLQAGRVHNAITDGDGTHLAGAVHARWRRDRFELKLQATTYDYDLASPAGVNDDVVVMGAYDFAYQVAADGRIWSAALSYDVPIDGTVAARWLDGVTLYEDFSVLTKSSAGFDASYHNVIGAALDVRGPLFVYADLAAGKNNAWIGPNFGDALAGGGEGDWETRFNVNIGVYF